MSDKAAKRFDLRTQVRVCALCPNMCRFQCPVSAVEKVETVSPRGKATLAVEVGRGDLSLTAETASVFYHCAACEVCREWCPSGVDLPEATAELKRRAAREGVAPEAAGGLARRLVQDRSLHGPASGSAKSLSRYRELLTPGAGVLYFAGCSTAALHPEVVGATLRLFEAAGVKVAMLAPEECCGLPLEALGYRDEASGFARGLARVVAEGAYRTVVSGCPMCTYVLKERYPDLGWPLGVEVKHVTEFLLDRHAEGALDGAGGGPGAVVTYHDPCYLGRYQDVYDPPRRVLTQVAGLRLVEMERNRGLAACCGGSPATETVVPDTATRIGTRRLEEARRTGADTLVTACPHCLDLLAPAAAGGHHASGAGDDAGSELAVRDITVVLAETLGLQSRPARGRGET